MPDTAQYDAMFYNEPRYEGGGGWMICKATTRLVSDSWVGAGNSFLHHIQNLVVFIYLLIIKLASCTAMYPRSPKFKSNDPDTGHQTVTFVI